MELTHNVWNNSHRKVIIYLFRHLPWTLTQIRKMVSLDNFFFVPNLCQIILLLFIFNLPNIFSQDSSPSNPTIAQCTSTLISLIPCTPFVQGTVPSPGSLCCGNLKQIYSQEPHCLCLLLNGTTFSSLPINRTLAMQLPALCNLQVNANISTCLGCINSHI